MRKLSVGRFNLLTVILLASSSWAQEESLENWYQVEVIVFAQEDQYGEEAYPENPELTYPQNLRLLNPQAPLFDGPPENPGYNETLAALMVPIKLLSRENAKARESFVLLEKEQRNLNPDAYALDRNSNYRVLFHGAWEQQVNGRRSAPWAYISGGEKYDNHRELEGSVRVYRSRFLHINFNLWQSRFTPHTAGEADPLATAIPAAPVLPEPPQQPPSRLLQQLEMMDPIAIDHQQGATVGMSMNEAPAAHFRVATLDILNWSEQISENSLAYVDHPRMGALVLISPIKKDENEEQLD